MADAKYKIKAAKEVSKLKDTDFCEVLTEFSNINDPVLVRIHIDEESKTGTKYTCSNSADKGLNPYSGGYYVLELLFGNTYPEKVPTVLFKTPILHANVSKTDGYICLDALNKWGVSFIQRLDI